MSGGDLQTGAALASGLEVRRSGDGSVRLAGRFPYSTPAVLSDGGRNGRPVKERIEPGAFRFALEAPERDIHFLAGHSFDRPLASKLSGTLSFRDTSEALFMTAIITPAILRASYAQDAIAQVEAGLAVGLSPGFRLPPERAVPREQAEAFEDEPNEPDKGMHAARIRKILDAILVELSLVTRPAYSEATVEMARASRSDKRTTEDPRAGLVRGLNRWRA